MVTVEEGDPKAPFSIPKGLQCKGGCHTFSLNAHFNIDMNPLMLSVKQRVSSNIF